MQPQERCSCRSCVVCLIEARVRNEELKRRLEENKPAIERYLARKRLEARTEQLKCQATALRARLKRLSEKEEKARCTEMETQLVALQRQHVEALWKYLPLESQSPREVLVVNIKIPTGNVEQIVIPPDQLALVLGYAVHFLHILAGILDVILPFEMTFCGSTSSIAPRGSNTTYPLYPGRDKGVLKKATTMLGLNVSALCYSQGLVIPMDRIGDIFVNLLRLKQHPALGRAEGPIMNYDVSSLLDPSHEDDISAIDERREWAFVDS